MMRRFDEATPETSLDQDSASGHGIPPVHVSPPVVVSDCADAGATLIYVISSDSNLMSFYPPTATFTMIGPVMCGSDIGSESSLASIDTTTFALHVIGVFNPPIEEPELTGTGAGDLFAFDNVGAGSAIGRVDKTNAQLTEQSALAGVNQGTAYAFAIWGGDFYTFTQPVGPTIVTRFRPTDGSIVQVAESPRVIVGAGVFDVRSADVTRPCAGGQHRGHWLVGRQARRDDAH
jgi:hypothetical protein